MQPELRVSGKWPGRVTLRRGWALAHARPWNDQSPHVAALRLDRGNDRFLRRCLDWLAPHGVERVQSSAVAESQSQVWRRAGFADHLELVVFERSLHLPWPPPARPVSVEGPVDPSRLVAIDDRAFVPEWRVGRLGLAEAMEATPGGATLLAYEEGALIAFCIVGELAGTSYLQRLAVDPRYSGKGVGRDLVRAAFGWARRRGARTMLLNTQPDNHAAAGLYQSEGFRRLPSPLWVLAARPER